MSRDYKPSSRRSEKKSGSPMLIGVVIGLFVGLGVSVAVALLLTRNQPTFTEKGSAKPAEAARAGAEKTLPAQPPLDDGLSKTPDNKPRFDFYNILPGKEEPVTDQEFKKAAQQPAADKAKAKESYFLQVGSFPNAADADNLKARLALMGVEAGIQTTDIPGKGVWHRVRVGPFTSVDDMNRVRGTLTQNQIPSTLVKIKEEPGT